MVPVGDHAVTETTGTPPQPPGEHIARRVTVVVVTHRPVLDLVARCIESVVASSVAADLIVVDNGSDRRTIDAVRRLVGAHGVVIALDTNRGFAAAVNVAIAASQRELVFLLNDDAALDPEALALAVARLDASGDEVVGVVPKVLLAAQPEVIDSAGVVLRPNGEGFNRAIGEPDVGQFAPGDRCLGPCFAAALIRRTAFAPDDVGPLDERYFLYYEDVDWVVRANLAGHHFVLEPAALVRHGHATSTRRLGLARRYRLVERNLLVQATTNLTAASAARIWARRLVDHGIAMVRGPYRVARLRAVAGALVHLPGSVRLRRRVRHRAITDETLFADSIGETPHFDATSFTAPHRREALAAAYRRKLARFGGADLEAIVAALSTDHVDGATLDDLLADEPAGARRYAEGLGAIEAVRPAGSAER